MTKSALAGVVNVTPGRISQLITEGKLTAPALLPNGRIDLPAALEQIGPFLRSPPPQLELDQATTRALQPLDAREPVMADARTRRALADAETAELTLKKLKNEIYDKVGIDALGADLIVQITTALPAAVIEAAERGRACVTGPDARRVGEQIARSALQRLVDGIKAAAREVASDG